MFGIGSFFSNLVDAWATRPSEQKKSQSPPEVLYETKMVSFCTRCADEGFDALKAFGFRLRLNEEREKRLRLEHQLTEVALTLLRAIQDEPEVHSDKVSWEQAADVINRLKSTVKRYEDAENQAEESKARRDGGIPGSSEQGGQTPYLG